MSGRSGSGGVTATPWTVVVRPAVRSPTSSPAWVPPVADGTTTVSGRETGAPPPPRRVPGPASTCPIAPTIPVPPIATRYGRRPSARSSARTRSTMAARSARSSVAAWWTVAPSNSSRRTPGLGGSTGGPDRTRWTARPGLRAGRRGQPGMVRPAPAGRDERVGALGQRGADQELQVAQLVATERERQEVLALDPDLDAATERGGEARQGRQRRGTVDQAETREAQRIGDSRWTTRRMVPARIIRPMATRVTSRRSSHHRRPASGHGALDRDLEADWSGSERLYSSIVSTAPGRPDPDPPPRRLRDLDLHPVRRRRLHVGPDRRRAVDGGGGRRLHLHPGRRDPRRGQRVGDRAARRRADAQLPRFARASISTAVPMGPTTCRRRVEGLSDAVAAAAPRGSRAGRRPGGRVPERRLVGFDADRARSRRRAVHPQADLARGGLDRARDARHRPARGVHRRRPDCAWPSRSSRPTWAPGATARRSRC